MEEHPQVADILKKYGITKEECDRKISDLHLYQFSRNCCSGDWKKLPPFLELEEIVAQEIDQNLETDLEKRQSFFSEWQQRKGSDATYKALMSALLRIAHKDDAEYLCNLLNKTRSTQTSVTTTTSTITSTGTSVSVAGTAAAKGETRLSFSGWQYETLPETFSDNSVALFVADGAYFLKKDTLYLYRADHKYGEKWTELGTTLYPYSGLALIDKKLVTVGGSTTLKVSKNIYTLYKPSADSKLTWHEEFPTMPNAHWSPACYSAASHLIVMGGFGYLDATLCCVNVLDTNSRQWSTATNIPSLQYPQVVGCGDTLYLSSRKSDSFFRCQLGDLLASVHSESKVASPLWTKLQSLPCHQKGALVGFKNLILAVGGETNGEDLRSIYRYNKETNLWDIVGEMPTARRYVHVGILGDDNIVCAGGQSYASSKLKVMETAQITCSS